MLKFKYLTAVVLCFHYDLKKKKLLDVIGFPLYSLI